MVESIPTTEKETKQEVTTKFSQHMSLCKLSVYTALATHPDPSEIYCSHHKRKQKWLSWRTGI